MDLKQEPVNCESFWTVDFEFSSVRLSACPSLALSQQVRYFFSNLLEKVLAMPKMPMPAFCPKFNIFTFLRLIDCLRKVNILLKVG